MSDNNIDEVLDIPVMGGWDADTLLAPPGRELESDPQDTEQQLREHLFSSHDESVMWRRLYPPSYDRKSTSYFGGKPLLAKGVEWPRSFDNSSSLMFVGQLDLADVPDFSQRNLLPKTGMLYFFFGGDDDTPIGRLGRVVADFTGSSKIIRERPNDVAPMVDGYAPAQCGWLKKEQIFSFKYYKEFPRYDVEPVLCRFFRDHHPTYHWGETGRRYQEIWKREQSREIVKAFGKPYGRWTPSGCDYYRSGPEETLLPSQESNSPPLAPEVYGLQPRIGSEPWLPDSKWPYCWLFVEIAVAKIVKSAEYRGREVKMHHGATHGDYYAAHLKRWQKNIDDANRWLGRVSQNDYFKVLSDADHSEFRLWLMSIGQPELNLDPHLDSKKAKYEQAIQKWKTLGRRGQFPAAPNYSGGHDPFWQGRINEHIATSLMRGVELCLVEGFKEFSLIPPGVVEFFQWRHAPLSDGGRSFVRHQLLGAPRIMQQLGMQLAENHILLMQFDTDDPLHWMWGDVGLLQFWIKKEDLLRRRFDNVLVTIAS